VQKYLVLLIILFTFSKVNAADISALPAFVTPATTTDGIITHDSSKATGYKTSEIKFPAAVSGSHLLFTGAGTWWAPLTDAMFTALYGADQGIATDDDVLFSSVSIAKTSGTAGRLSVFEGNSTDTFKKGWEGPANITQDTFFKFSNDNPTADALMSFAAPSSGVSQQSWLYLNDMSSNVMTDGTVNGRNRTIVSATSLNNGEILPKHSGSEYVMTASGLEVGMPDCWSGTVGTVFDVWNKTSGNQIELVMYYDTSNSFVLSNGTILTANYEVDMSTVAYAHVRVHCFESGYWYVEDINGTSVNGGAAD